MKSGLGDVDPVTVHVDVDAVTAFDGGSISVVVEQGAGPKSLDIRVPKGIEDGARLRLRRPHGEGDVIVVCHVQRLSDGFMKPL